MHVSLTAQLEELVRRKVESGLYNNASEVVREALRLMVARDDAEGAKLATLRRALADGEASGPAKDFSMDRVSAQLDKENKRTRKRA